MKLKDKLVREVDEEVWHEFRVYCIKNKRKMGQMLSEVLMDYLHNQKTKEEIENEIKKD